MFSEVVKYCNESCVNSFVQCNNNNNNNNNNKTKNLKQRIYYTPGNVSVSSKHVLSLFDDGNRVTFPITPAVKGTGSPAVSGSAITQHPVRFQSNSRRQELIEVTLVRYISTNYSGIE